MPTNEERMMMLFAGHTSAYGSHGEPEQAHGASKWEIKASAKTLRGPVNVELWRKHLLGEQPLGIIPIREDSRCTWGSIDIDEYDESLLHLIAKVQALGLPLVPCRSKSGGMHLFLFLTQPVPAAEARASLVSWAAALGHSRAEVFPKQTKVLTAQGDVGNWIICPYFGGTYSGRIREQVGLRKTGAEMLLTEFLAVAEGARITPEQLVNLTKVPRLAPVVGRTGTHVTHVRHANGHAGPFSDGPPCLEHLVRDKVGEGNRNSFLFQCGIYYKRAYPSDWRERLENANRDHCDPPVTAEEVLMLIKSLAKDGKEYQYTCRTEPMHSHCDGKLCRMRRYGVGEHGAVPIIAGLSVLDTDPPIWFLDVDEMRVEVNTEDLMVYSRFQQKCAAQLHQFFAQVRQAQWIQILAEARKNLTVIKAPPEASIRGVFHELLEEFLTDRPSASRREELAAGLPFFDTEENRFYFRLRDLGRFLKQQGWRDVSRAQMTTYIRGMGGDSHTLMLGIGDGKQASCRVFWVPDKSIKGPITIPPPDMPMEPI